jgi:hypothetical protein
LEEIAESFPWDFVVAFAFYALYILPRVTNNAPRVVQPVFGGDPETSQNYGVLRTKTAGDEDRGNPQGSSDPHCAGG